MPRFLVSKKSTQHRIAAIALYRALLSGCSSAPLQNEDRESLRNAIQNKFRKNPGLQSPYQLGQSFKAGYATLDLLDASASGDAASTARLTELISQLPRGLIRKSISNPRPAPQPPKERLAALPPDRAVLNVRPYAKTSGPRRVPIMASANGIPFLRITKPQPPALSRVIRQRLAHKQCILDTKVLLENFWMPLATQEDKWDRILRQRTGLADQAEGSGEATARWSDAVALSITSNQRAFEADVAKDEKYKKQMRMVVEQETRLALKEGQTIIRGRRRKPLQIIRPPPKRK